jgi:hypothetical protein
LVWVLKDGLGMVGSLGFAYLFADAFETNIKEWRLLADVLNNVALTLDLCLSLTSPGWTVGLTAASAVCKSCCWVCAGATKGRVSAHFARDGCLADVIAKEGTQETAVALVGMALGAACAHFVGTDAVSTWAIFWVLLALHQWSNYQLVRALVLDTLNPQRCMLVTQLLLEHDVSVGSAEGVSGGVSGGGSGGAAPGPADASPAAVAARESLGRPLWLAGFGPQLGCSLDALLAGLSAAAASDDGAAATLGALRRCWAGEPFLIGFDPSARVVVALEEVRGPPTVPHEHAPPPHAHSPTHCCSLLAPPSQGCSEAAVRRACFLACYVFLACPTDGGLAYRYTRLVDRDAERARRWYEQTMWPRGTSRQRGHEGGEGVGDVGVEVEELLVSLGWDVGAGKQRLGDGPWRYTYRHDAPDTSQGVSSRAEDAIAGQGEGVGGARDGLSADAKEGGKGKGADKVAGKGKKQKQKQM